MRVIALIALFILATGAVGAAQEATPDAGAYSQTLVPVHLRAGTCAEPGEMVQALSDAGFGLPVAEAAATPGAVTQVGPAAANPAMVSVTTIGMTLDQLVADPHAIDVHRPAAGDETGTRIACGDVGGLRSGEDLVFGLGEVNGSNYGGTAWLRDNGDGSTTVTLFLASGFAQPDAADGTPAADEVAAGYESERLELQSLIVDDGTFAASVLRLSEGVPTVLHVANNDDQAYYFRLDDLVTTVALPANEVTVIEFTTPSPGSYGALLLADRDEAAGLDLLPVIVE